MALERFERLMVEQAPAKPWVPVTDYSFEAREPIEAPHADRIVETFHPQLVLDYGAGPGHLVRLLRARGVFAYGYEPFLQPCPELHRTTHIPFSDQKCDLVICREVLEHIALRHIASTVADLCRLARRYVYLTTRFHPAPLHLLDVATSDDLDPTHITMLNQDFLRALIVLHGFTRDRAKEQAMDWQHKGRVLVYERV